MKHAAIREKFSLEVKTHLGPARQMLVVSSFHTVSYCVAESGSSHRNVAGHQDNKYLCKDSGHLQMKYADTLHRTGTTQPVRGQGCDSAVNTQQRCIRIGQHRAEQDAITFRSHRPLPLCPNRRWTR
jgi:hypothetical protein